MVENADATHANTGRRTTFAASLWLTGLPASVGQTKASPDAELIRLAALLEAHHLEINSLNVADPLNDAELTMRLTALLEARYEIVDRLAASPATTLAGLQAKAAGLLACARLDRNGDHDWRNLDELLGCSLARDLVGDHVAERDPRLAPAPDSEEED